MMICTSMMLHIALTSFRPMVLFENRFGARLSRRRFSSMEAPWMLLLNQFFVWNTGEEKHKAKHFGIQFKKKTPLIEMPV